MQNSYQIDQPKTVSVISSPVTLWPQLSTYFNHLSSKTFQVFIIFACFFPLFFHHDLFLTFFSSFLFCCYLFISLSPFANLLSTKSKSCYSSKQTNLTHFPLFFIISVSSVQLSNNSFVHLNHLEYNFVFVQFRWVIMRQRNSVDLFL